MLMSAEHDGQVALNTHTWVPGFTSVAHRWNAHFYAVRIIFGRVLEGGDVSVIPPTE